MSAGRSSAEAVALFADDFELGDGFEVLGPAGGTFGSDQILEVEESTMAPKALGVDRAGVDVVIPADACHFAQTIERADIGRQSEI